MNPSQYSMPTNYIPGTDPTLASQMNPYMVKDQPSDQMHQSYMNPQLPINPNMSMDPKQLPQFQNMPMPQGQVYPNSFYFFKKRV